MFCLGSVLFSWQFRLRVCVLCCVVSVACLFCSCLLGGCPLLGRGGHVGAPVASFRCSCLVFLLYLIFTCYITRYLCAGREEGRASRFFLLLTRTSSNTVLQNYPRPSSTLHKSGDQFGAEIKDFLDECRPGMCTLLEKATNLSLLLPSWELDPPVDEKLASHISKLRIPKVSNWPSLLLHDQGEVKD